MLAILLAALLQQTPLNVRIGPWPPLVEPPNSDCHWAVCWPQVLYQGCCPVSPIGLPMDVTAVPATFTAAQLHVEALWMLNPRAACRGGIVAGGVVRYFLNGTAPSPTVGYLAPAVPPGTNDGTFDGREIVLLGPERIRGFKTVSAASTHTTIHWVCSL